MRSIREARIPLKTANGNYPFAVLWDTIVGYIHLPEMNLVACLNQRVEQVQQVAAAVERDEALDILEQKYLRCALHDQLREGSHQGVAVVAVLAATRRGEALARWSADHHIAWREAIYFRKVAKGDVMVEVGSIAFDSRQPIVIGSNDFEARFLEAEGQASTPTE